MWGSNSHPQDQESLALPTEPARQPSAILSASPNSPSSCLGYYFRGNQALETKSMVSCCIHDQGSVPLRGSVTWKRQFLEVTLRSPEGMEMLPLLPTALG